MAERIYINLILGNLKQVGHLREVIGEEQTNSLLKTTKENYQEPLRKAFTSLMNCPKDKLDKALKALKEQIDQKTCLTSTEMLFKRSWHDFPGDVGCFVIYFLNTIVLKPGENDRLISSPFFALNKEKSGFPILTALIYSRGSHVLGS